MSRHPLMGTIVTLFFMLAASGAIKAPATVQRLTSDGIHPRIRAAITELQEARRELEAAGHDFGGRRKEAIDTIDNALKALREALKYDKESTGPSSSPQRGERNSNPHIKAAVRELKAARHELESAAHDFGGRRKEAIEAVDQAIKALSPLEEGDPPPYPTPKPTPKPRT